MKNIPLSDLGECAREVLERVPEHPDRAAIVALFGELGAGKTTFVQAFAKELGVQDVVQSPTYVLMKSYPILYKHFTQLVHIDAYRLNNSTEFATLKPEKFLNDPRALVCVEWPEKVDGALPQPDLTLRFSSEGAGENERYIEIV